MSALLATNATPRFRTEPIGIELRHLIDALTQSGRDLLGVADSNLTAHVKEVLDGMAALSCRIAVVGQVKAGKSSFINALIQRRDLLPTHVNPWTAVATRLQFGMPGRPVTGSDFTFFTAEEWAALGMKANGAGGPEYEDGFAEMKQRAELRLGDQFHHLLGKAHYYQSVQPEILQNYLCAGPPVEEISREVKPGRYADITKAANVYFPFPPMAMPAIVIDTPGTNDPTHLRHRITREIIEGADLYIVVITARQALASSDLGLLKLLRGLEKRRIVLFINRIDELSGRPADAELVRQHVQGELARIFDGAAIPVIVGSAKWAGLAATEDLERLRAEALSPFFRAFAAEKRIPLPEGEGDLDQLQDCFRAASGLNGVARLLSLFMLSGFVANHAKGVANVMLSAADMSTTNARRELHALAGQLRELQTSPTIGRRAAADVSACLAEMGALFRAIGEGVQAVKTECAPAIRDGIARLGSALEADIRVLPDETRGPGEAPPAAPTRPSEPASAEDIAAEAPEPPQEEPDAPESAGWLASVKEATFGLLRRAGIEAPTPQPEMARKPSTVRGTSLTTPVTASEALSLDSGSSWWSGWGKDGQPGGNAEAGEPGAAQGGIAERAGRHSFRDLYSGEGARPMLASLGLLSQLADRFRALASAGGNSAENELLAKFVAAHERSVNDACLAIAVHEKVNRQLKTLFMPQGGAE